MMLSIKALFYALFHRDTVHLTVVRRYVDAQKRFIGELYEGSGRDAWMMGMTCDTMPFSVGDNQLGHTPCRLELGADFLAPMMPGGLRVGAMEPMNNETVRQTIALRRYCKLRVVILNRFVEHVMAKDHV